MVYWVFGYGSLIYKRPPHAVETRNGYVKGVVRRFAQSSDDHRGTPEKPGRVVTVIEGKDWHKIPGTENESSSHREDEVWGQAIRIDPEHEEDVKKYLLHREKHGFTVHHMHVYDINQETGKEEVVVEDAECYVGTVDNHAFVGYEEPQQLAQRIFECSGPSGPNRDYLYQLADSMRELFPHVEDRYLFELEASVKALEAEEKKKWLPN